MTSDFERFTSSYEDSHPDEIGAIKKEHLERLTLGKDKWNKWATAFKDHIRQDNITDAVINLSEIEIKHRDFVHYHFPAVTRFNKATFSGGHASFDNAKFSGERRETGPQRNGAGVRIFSQRNGAGVRIF